MSQRRDVQEVFAIRERLRRRKKVHCERLAQEAKRLSTAAAALGVQRVVLFGSLARGQAGLSSDLDLLIVWDTPLDFMARTVELYRRLAPRVATEMLVYTPDEMRRMAQRPFVRRVLAEGKVLYEA